jgi:hypothetical protein
MKRKKHWYMIHYYECPICGSGGEERIRMYGRRPKSVWRRVRFHSLYDQCVGP